MEQYIPIDSYEDPLETSGLRRTQEIIAETPPPRGRTQRTREEVLHDRQIIIRFGSRRLAQAALDRQIPRDV